MRTASSFLALALCIFSLITCRQDSTAQIVLQGQVADSASGKSLEQVFIRTTDGRSGTLTGRSGRFELTVDALPVLLEYRLLGYYPGELLVTEKKDLNIRLRPLDVYLDQITVSAQAAERLIAGTTRRSIFDYAWCDSSLLICDYGNSLRKSRLILLSLQGDTIAVLSTPAKPVRLFNDCLGNAHFQGTDSTWQIVVSDRGLSLLKGHDNHMIDHLLRHCLDSDTVNLYFSFPSGNALFESMDPTMFRFNTHDHTAHIFFGNRETNSMTFITKVEDEVALRLIAEEASYGNGPDGKPFPESGHSEAASKVFFYRTLLRPIYAPIFAHNDSVYLADHIHGKLVVFAPDGNTVRVASLPYSTDPAFAQHCAEDPFTGEIYVVMNKEGFQRLCLLDKVRGQISSGVEIPYPFPDHITVRNGVAYYLRRHPEIPEARILCSVVVETN